ncbi:MAG: hypothetical protein C4346_14745 [Chloroflexota bacterium]
MLAEVRLEHLGTLPAEIRLAEISLLDCAGHRYAAEVPPGTPAPGVIPIPRDQAMALTVRFTVPLGTVPVRLIIPIHREGLTGGRVEFPLVVLDRPACLTVTAGAGEESSSSATTSSDSPEERRDDDAASQQRLPGC